MQGGYKGNDYPGLTEKSSFEDMQAFFRHSDYKGSDRAAICGPAALPAPCAPGARVQVSKSEQAPGNTFKQGDKALWPELFEGVRKTEQPVVILVLSRRTGFSVRQAIRQTWAKGHDNVFFVVGASCPIPLKDRVNAPYGACLRQFVSPADRQAAWNKEELATEAKLEQELKDHADLARMPGIDSYASLPEKVKFAYDWGLVHIPAAQWFVKVDDDQLARVQELGQWLTSQLDATKPTVVGGIRRSGKVHRTGQWAETHYTKSIYPPFPIGSSGHIVSRPVAQYIATHSKELFNFQGEDVSIGIWLDESPLKDKVVWKGPDDSRMSNSGQCSNRQDFVIGHNFDEQQIRECFQDHWPSPTQPDNVAASQLAIVPTPPPEPQENRTLITRLNRLIDIGTKNIKEHKK